MRDVAVSVTTATATQSAAERGQLFGALAAVFRDVRVRHGIKTASAALLALWITQVLRLEHPSWSVLGTLVLSNTYYVGAVASRALMRSLGTVCGAFIGVWAVGEFGDDPVRFIVIVFVVVTAAVYQYGRLDASAWPYAYYLVGLTLTSVSTYGIADPTNVWRSALQRVLETLVAVFCATFVTAVVWPRYANEEFAAGAAEALRTVCALLLERVRSEAPTASGDPDAAFIEQILRLRTLIVTGGRGSIHFHAGLGNLQRFLVALTHLRHATLGLAQPAAWTADPKKIPRAEIDDMAVALDHDLTALAEMAATGLDADSIRLAAAYGPLETRLCRGVTPDAPLPEQEAVCGYLVAWRQVRDELQTLRAILGKLPRQHLPPVRSGDRVWHWPVIDVGWVCISLKASVSVCLAFLLLRWVHPPGANALPVAALMFTAGGRYSLAGGGKGDLRVLQTAFLSFLLGFPLVGLCWVLLPMLTNYWAMNLVLFALCFGLSFTLAQRPTFTFGRLVAVLGISTFVGLNPNEPVAFHTLLDAYLGMMVGVGLGALVTRVLWPVLPQGMLRGHMIRFFGDLRTLLADTNRQAYIFSQTATLPVEAMQAIRQMALPGCPPEEREKLAAFVEAARPLGLQIAALGVSIDRANAAEEFRDLRSPLRELTAGIDEFLAGSARCFQRRDPRLDVSALARPLLGLEESWMRLHGEAFLDDEQTATALELLNRCRVAVDRLQAVGTRLEALHLRCYLGDVAL